MYQSNQYSQAGIESKLNGYFSKAESFTLADAVSEAYNCEGCRIAQERSSGKYKDSKAIIIPKTYSEKQDFHSSVQLNDYGSKIGAAYGTAFSLSNNRTINAAYGSEEATRQYHQVSATYANAPIIFLKEQRKKFPIVEDEKRIIAIAKETFSELMGRELPKEISISILSKEQFKDAHSEFGRWSEGIVGFAINGKEKKVFARAAPLDELMMVLGHEIGHLNSDSLSNQHDEEAKAFSFSEAWVRCIKKHNIGNLAGSIKDESDWAPAQNGLHDVAFNFVRAMMGKGIAPMNLHSDLSKKYRSIFNVYV